MVKRDQGAMEAFLLAATLALTALTMMLVTVILLVARHEQVRAAADFAALTALQSPRGCVDARGAAERNSARLDTCILSDVDVRVTASLDTGLSAVLLRAGLPARFVVHAHATR